MSPLMLPLAPLLVLVGEPPTLNPPFRLQDGWLGSPEIRLHAELPPNTAKALAVDLVDPAARRCCSSIRRAGASRGYGRRTGVRGRYDKSDAELRLQLRPLQWGDHTLQLALEAFTDAAARPCRRRFQVTADGSTIADRITQQRHHDWIEAFLVQHQAAA
ncbi:MAG: hypothetical protein R6U00_05870 [Prochlorococcaceae cyanobacterium]